MSAVRIETGPDVGAIWHYGDPLREQRLVDAGQAHFDLSHLPTFEISGPDRLNWLHAITTQDFNSVSAGEQVSAYILNHQGHIIHGFTGIDDGESFTAHTEPGHLDELLDFLAKMKFATKVEVTPLSGENQAATAGWWAHEALRIAAGIPRIFLDTDDKTLPNELANPGFAPEAELDEKSRPDRLGQVLRLNKGCYPGQETVARIYNVGSPPRRLTRLLLDGSVDRLPELGAEVFFDQQSVGRMGTCAIHYELGPIGLALLKRTVPLAATLTVAGIPASQEVIVDPDVGEHFRLK